MDIVDRDIERAEVEATRTWSARGSLERQRDFEKAEAERASKRTASRASTDTSSTGSSSSVGRGLSSAATASIARTRTHPIEQHRTETHRLQHSYTVGAHPTKSRASTKPLPEFGGGKPYPPPLPEREEYVVEYDGKDDPLHPQNWMFRRKFAIGAILAYNCLCSTLTSSIFSTATKGIMAEFHVSTEVAVISSSLYILGYAFGPLAWGPFSELEGRKLPILIAGFGFMVFNFAVAAGKDLQTIMICRFWAGVFGSCPLSVVAAVFADMFDNRQRGPAVVVFASCVFMGPMLGPFIGGFIILNPSLGWRWTSYIAGIMGALSFGLNVLFLRESYPPVVLVSKAAELRRRTKNWGIHAKQEEVEVDMQELITKNFSRPIRLLFTEPVVLLVTIYMSFIYGLLYCFLTAYPIIFQGVHGFNPGVGGLPFFGLVCGVFLAAAYIIFTSTSYNKKLQANAGMPVPEWRLPPVIVGGVCFAVGLFWLGWTGHTKSIPWIVPTLSGLLTGFGLLAIFIQLFNYIIESYLMFAASAIAANTFLRSCVAAGFPLFSRQMFINLHIQWAGTLLGCLATAMVPIPICFYLFGKKLRARGKYSPTMMLKPPPPDDSTEEEAEDEIVSAPPPMANGSDQIDGRILEKVGNNAKLKD